MPRYVSGKEIAADSPRLNDPRLTRSMALHFLDRLRRDLDASPPDSRHLEWIRPKIAYYERLLKALSEDDTAA